MKILHSLALAAGLGLLAAPALAAGAGVEIPDTHFSFDGHFGTYDMAQVRRGYQVYKEVCSACHGLKLLSYRNLSEEGGPFYTGMVDGKNPGEEAVKALIAEIKTPDTDDFGDPIDRPVRLSDRFVYPFANEKAGRAANGGAYPPDLSVMAKARAGGPDYIHALLTGYVDPPAGFDLQEGMNYNKYFPGHQIKMSAPLVADGQVTYNEPNSPEATIDQMATDVSAFLMWAAEPTMTERKQLGFQVMIFLAVLTGLLYLSYRRVWHGIDH